MCSKRWLSHQQGQRRVLEASAELYRVPKLRRDANKEFGNLRIQLNYERSGLADRRLHQPDPGAYLTKRSFSQKILVRCAANAGYRNGKDNDTFLKHQLSSISFPNAAWTLTKNEDIKVLQMIK